MSCPGWDLNPHRTEFETAASAVGLPGRPEYVSPDRAKGLTFTSPCDLRYSVVARLGGRQRLTSKRAGIYLSWSGITAPRYGSPVDRT